MRNRGINRRGYGGEWENARHNGSGRIMGGLLLVVVGVLVLAVKTHHIFLPHWVFSWQMFLIVLGLFTGFRHNFRKPAWLVLVIIGTVFLLNDLVAGFDVQLFFWPILLIGAGLFIMLRPRRNSFRHFGERRQVSEQPAQSSAADSLGNDMNEPLAASTEDYVDSTTIYGGTKKYIISKDFKGGEVVSVFGGTELNLTQSDIQHPVVLETTQIFGGTSLVIPAHWQVQSEVTAILGGIDDKRPIMPKGYEPGKVLVLKGLTLFGGLSIKSY